METLKRLLVQGNRNKDMIVGWALQVCVRLPLHECKYVYKFAASAFELDHRHYLGVS
jgi:hypothetical protein